MNVGDKYRGKTKTVYEIIRIGLKHVTIKSDYSNLQRYELPKVTTMPKQMFLDLFEPLEKEQQ